MDFGLAKGQDLELSKSGAGGLLGTLRYAAPEQLAAASLRVGPEADVRGLGVTLWELLTRRRLFAAAADERQLASMVHDHDVPRLRTIDRGLDRDLEAIVARATERRVVTESPRPANWPIISSFIWTAKPLPIRPPSIGAGRAVGPSSQGTRQRDCGRNMPHPCDGRDRNRPGDGFAESGCPTRTEKSDLAQEKSRLAEANGNLAEAERRRRIESELRLAEFDLERGQNLATDGRLGEGLLWLGRALKDSPDDPRARSQQRLIRMSLGSVMQNTNRLGRVLPHADRINDMTFSSFGCQARPDRRRR